MVMGLKYAFVGCLIAMVLGAIVCPIIYPQADNFIVGVAYANLMFLIVGLPLYFIGNKGSQKEKTAEDTSKKKS